MHDEDERHRLRAGFDVVMAKHHHEATLGGVDHKAFWRKSSYSGSAGDCVEVAHGLPGSVAVRDSKDPGGPTLVFTHHEWTAFLARMRRQS